MFSIRRRSKCTNWPVEQPKWEGETLNLLKTCSKIQRLNTNLEIVMRKSKKFPINFPITTMLCKNLRKVLPEETLENYIHSAYPLIHEHALYLCAKFLLFKRQYGSKKEQELYKKVSLKDLINRLLTKRAVSFYGESDTTLTIEGKRYIGEWEIIGTNREDVHLNLEKNISYDEIKLSALLSITSKTYFINDGNRDNAGKVEIRREVIQPEGVIVGLIGTRFEREMKMEYEDICISVSQNTENRGYGEGRKPTLQKLFAEFYEEPSYLFDRSVLRDRRFTEINRFTFFNNVVYSKRLSLSFDTLLIEANHRAKYANKFAYIHVVGLGLGVWKVSPHQTDVYMSTFGERLKFLGKHLTHVSDVHFAYISGAKHCGEYSHGNHLPIPDHPYGGITIHISKREPHTRLQDKNKILIVSYAWDGNALPGNEYWFGMLRSTGDTAAACSTQITELHNPHINPFVCADNLHVALLDGTVVPLAELVSLRSNIEE